MVRKSRGYKVFTTFVTTYKFILLEFLDPCNARDKKFLKNIKKNFSKNFGKYKNFIIKKIM